MTHDLQVIQSEEVIQAMTTTELRKEAVRRIKTLPAPMLKVATEFLKYLDERASDEATRELLRVPGLLKDVNEADRLIKAGKGRDWRKVRQDV